MSLLHTISLDTLTRLVGTPACLTLIDVQTDEDFTVDPRVVPGAVGRPWAKAADWAAEFDRRLTVVIPQEGLKLRHRVATVPVLEGGRSAWVNAPSPMALGYAAWPRSSMLREHSPAADSRRISSSGKGFDERGADVAITHHHIAA